MSAFNFGATSISRNNDFSWVFLVDWIMVSFVSLFIVFYLNRAIAWVLSQILGWILWHRYRIFFKASNVSLSLLGGRLFFKNLVYVGDNEAFSILQGHFTWQYWRWHVRSPSIPLKNAPNIDPIANAKLPSRLRLTCQGVEWFVYNRTAAYEIIEENLQSAAQRGTDSASTDTDATAFGSANGVQDPEKVPANGDDAEPSSFAKTHFGKANFMRAHERANPGVPDALSRDLSFLEFRALALFPFEVYMYNAAVIMGNPQTQSLLVGRTKRVAALLDVDQPSNQLDRYMVKLNAKFQKPVFELVPNFDYMGESALLSNPPQKVRSSHSHKRLAKLLGKRQKGKRLSWAEPWTGLSRYNSREDVMKEPAGTIKEYAKVSTILECEKMEIDYYFDVVGPAPESSNGAISESELHEPADFRSGFARDQLPRAEPLFGTDVKLWRPSINYGPWAERQRVELFEVFFPRSCRDALPAHEPAPGQPRQYKDSKLLVQFETTAVMRIPVREFSKDAQFAVPVPPVPPGSMGEEAANGRTFGWIEMVAAANSSVSYTAAMLPGETGWKSNAFIDLRAPELSTSVNHSTLLEAQSHTINVDMVAPLAWNGLQNWTISNASKAVKLFFLRDHSSLITDTIQDFGSGAPVPYALFTPVVYDIKWKFDDFSLFFNVNSQNIINNPTSISENTFLVLRTPAMDSSIQVPLIQVAPVETTVDLAIDAAEVTMDLSAPSWHTLGGFLDHPTVARVDDFKIRHSIHYYEDPQAPKPETHRLSIDGDNFVMLCYGFLIEYLMVWTENYFGTEYHYQTTSEFLEKRDHPEMEKPFQFDRKEVDVDSMISSTVNNATFIMPGYLYSARDNIALNANFFAVECRFTNYYMDLQMQALPVKGFMCRNQTLGDILRFDPAIHPAQQVLFASDLSTQGHRMFGLPPSEPTYNCKWDFDLSPVSVNADFSFLLLLGQVGDCFKHSTDDLENKPRLPSKVLFDVTFVSLRIPSINAKFVTKDGSSVAYILEPLSLNFNDLANEHYSAKAQVNIPKIEVTLEKQGKRVFQATTSLEQTLFLNKREAKHHYEAQQDHITLHDSLFHRCPFFLDDEHRRSDVYGLKYAEDVPHIDPRVPLPKTAAQITRETAAILDPRLDILSAVSRNPVSAGTIAQSDYRSNISLYSSSEGESDSCDDLFEMPGSPGRVRQNMDKGLSAGGLEDNEYLPPPGWAIGPDPKQEPDDVFLTAGMPWRSTAPYIPPAEDDRLYANFILELGNVEVVADITVISPVLEIVQAFAAVDIEALFDASEIELVERLIGEKEKTCKRVHLVVPQINISVGNESQQDETTGALVLPKDFVFANFVGLKLKHQHLEDPSTDKPKGVLLPDIVEVKTSENGRVELDSALFGIRHGAYHDAMQVNPLLLQVFRPAFWWHDNSKTGLSELKIGHVDLFLATEQVPWLTEYMVSILLQVPFDKFQPVADKKQLQAAAILAVAEAADKQGVSDDTYVLSRPSGAVQSADHVRSAVSWRIAMRLRYLLQSLPRQAVEKTQDDLVRPGFRLPKDAMSRIKKQFKSWRSWEHHDGLNKARIFDLFGTDMKGESKFLKVGMHTVVDSVAFRAGYPSLKEDYVLMDNLRIVVAKHQVSGMSKYNIAHNSDRVKVRLSKEITLIIENAKQAVSVLSGALPKLPQRPEVTPEPVKEISDARVAPESTRDNADESGNVVQALIISMVKDISVELVFESLYVELQNKDVQASLAVEHRPGSADVDFFSSGVLVSRSAAVRVIRAATDLELGHYLLENMYIGFASKGFPSTGTYWVNIDLGDLSLAVDATIEEVADAATEFLELDLPQVLEALKTVEEMKSEPGPEEAEHASVDPGPSVENVGNVEIQVASINVRVKVVPNITASLAGYSLVAKLRAPNKTSLLCLAELDSHVLNIYYNERSRLGNFVLEGARGLARVDLPLNAVDASITFQRLRLETTSVMRILEFIKGHNVIAALESTKRSLDRLERAVDKVRPEFSERSEPSSTALINMALAFEEIVVTLPLEKASFKFSILKLRGSYEEFAWRKPGKDGSDADSPVDAKTSRITIGQQSYSSSLKDLNISLVQAADVHRVLSIQLTASSNKNRGENSFHLTSEYCIVSLNPRLIGAISVAAHTIEAHASEFLARMQDPEAGPAPAPERPLPSVAPQRFKISSKLKASIALSRFNFTWGSGITAPPGIAGDGISVGYEILQVNMAQLRARMDLRGFYIAPAEAVGQKVGIEHQLNTAYLPHVKLIGVLSQRETDSMVYLKLSGESLRLDLTPAVAQLLAGVVDSIEMTQEILQQEPSLVVKRESQPQPQVPQARGGPGFIHGYSFHVDAKFDTAVVRLWEDPGVYGSKLAFSDQEPSLELLSPAVDFTIQFMSSDDGSDSLYVSVNVSETSNVIYPKALVEVRNIVHYAGQIVRERRVKRNAQARTKTANAKANARALSRRPSLSSFGSASGTNAQIDHKDIHRLLEQISLNFKVHFGAQTLSLSSMPYSKVVASYSTKGVDVFVNTVDNLQGDRSLALLMVMDNAKVSLQHMYSRETSGYFKIGQIIANGTHRISGDLMDSSFQMAVKLVAPEFEIKANQLYDIKLFKDIWLDDTAINSFRQTTPENTPETPLETASGHSAETLASQYSAVTKTKSATMVLPWSVNFEVSDVSGIVDMGQSIGVARLKVNRVWVALFKLSGMEQYAAGGIEGVEGIFEGRVSGNVKMTYLRMRVQASWEAGAGAEAGAGLEPHTIAGLELPFIQAAGYLGKLTGSLGLDYHPFLAFAIEDLQLGLGNQRELVSDSVHKLLLTVSCGSIWLVCTSLVASNILDVMKLLGNIDPRAVASGHFFDESAKPGGRKGDETAAALKAAAKAITTGMHVDVAVHLSRVKFVAFPTELNDTVAMRVSTKDVSVAFSQTQSDGGDVLKSKIDLSMTSFHLSILTVKARKDDLLSGLSTDALLQYIQRAGSGTTVVSIPHFKIAMKTTDLVSADPREVRFVFVSAFDGYVEVGWNLGAINFFREMLETHKQALHAHQLIRKRSFATVRAGAAAQSEPPVVVADSEASRKPRYVPVEPPVIVIPQLHDMGDATPPVEWVGLDRQNLPYAVHWYVIRVLNGGVEDARQVYEELLRRV